MRTFRFLVGLLLLIATLPAVAQNQPALFLSSPPTPPSSVYRTLISASTRNVVALNGDWEVSSDGGDSWERVRVPSCYLGSSRLLFRRSFQVPKRLLSEYRWKLVGYGMQYNSSVKVNGQFVTQRESAIPFAVRVPEEIPVREKNVIEIEIDNRLDHSATVPGRKLPLDTRTYGGIIHDIFLVGVPRVWIDDVRIARRGNNAREVVLEAGVVAETIKGMRTRGGSDSAGAGGTIAGDEAEFTLSVVLSSTVRNDSTGTNETARGEQRFKLQSKRTSIVRIPVQSGSGELWRPGNPTLNEAKVQLRYNGALVDEQIVDVGGRTFTPKGDKLYVNDSAITVKGIIYVEDSEKYGASLPHEQMQEDMEEIRDLGVNLVRFTAGPPHPYILELCDRLGILALIDVPIGTPPAFRYGNDGFRERALNRTISVVESTRRYSCVVGYGFGSFMPDGAVNAVDFLKSARSVVDSLAPDALFYAVSDDWSNAELQNVVDIAGVALFDGEAQTVLDLVTEAKADLQGKKPLVVLAYGKLVNSENQRGYSDPVSTQAQAKYISDVYTIIQQSDIAGGICWAFNDYRTDRPLLTVANDDQYVASCGLFSLDREVRIGGKMLGALYTDQRQPDIAIGEYSPPSTVIFIAIGIACAITFLLLINSSRRFRENVFRALLRPYNFYADIRDQRILSTLQTSVLALVISATLAVVLASLCYYYRMDERFDLMLGALVTSDGLKGSLNTIIWEPALAIIVFTVVGFLALLLVAGLIRVFSIFVRNRIFFSDAWTISVWGALPVLLLIPIAMILYRLLEVPSAGIVAFTIMVAVLLWMIYRVLRGTAVIYDIRSSKVYGYALGSIAVLIIIMLVTSDDVHATFSYLKEGIESIYTQG